MNTLQIRLLSFALFAIFCAILTYQIVLILTTTHSVPEPAVAISASVISIDKISTLFGGKYTRSINQVVRLFGIFALKQSAAAIISVGDGPPKTVSLGNSLTQDIKLAEIRARSIVIDWNGVRSEVFLPVNAARETELPTIYVH